MKLAKQPKGTEAEVGKLSDLRYIDLSNIANSTELHYRELNDEHVAELSESIEHNGLTSPLLVWDGGAPDTLMKIKDEKLPASFLLAGAHRREALRKFKKRDEKAFNKMFPEGIPVQVFHGDTNAATGAQLRENVQRKNPTLAETLPFVIKLQKAGVQGKKIARLVGKSKSWVSEVLSIEETLGEEGLEEAKNSDLSIRDARKLKDKAKKAKDKGEEFDVKAEVKKAKDKKKDKTTTPKRVSIKALYARYRGLPNMKQGDKIRLLEELLEYAAGESDVLPEELKVDDEQESAPKKKKSKSDKSE